MRMLVTLVLACGAALAIWKLVIDPPGRSAGGRASPVQTLERTRDNAGEIERAWQERADAPQPGAD